MWKVKLFDEDHEQDLEAEINAFLEDEPNLDIKEIQFETSICCCDEEDTIYSYSALILYKKRQDR
ncbi:sporulation protein Cse60 [Fictibacillus iocasae]|uniref:Sporulation protein Cse60 n=1 Tax=Fictibacillus iocasae TaxID=2715437 RepID=A0ABW2NVN8_9BACL